MQDHTKRFDSVSTQPNSPSESQALPRFLQAGLSFLHKYENVRRQGFQQRLIVADLLKTRGNALFKEERTREACLEYEQGLSIFRYVLLKNNEVDMKGNGKYEYVDFEGEREDERVQVRNLKVLLYNNLAASYLKLNDSPSAKAACDEALRLDPKQTKALYRRARAIISVEKVSYDEYSAAYEDLKVAIALTPNDANLLQLKTKVKAEMSKLESAGNQFKGMFNNLKKSNGNNDDTPVTSAGIFPKTVQEKVHDLIYGNLDSEDKCLDYLLCYEVDPSRPIPEGVEQLETFMEARGKEMLTFCEKIGRFDQAKEVRDTLEKARDAKKRIEKFASLNLEKPTPYLKITAEKHGLEVEEPLIRREFERLQQRSYEELTNLFMLLGEKSRNMNWTTGTDDKFKKERPTIENEKSSFMTSNTAITTNNYYINNNYYTSASDDILKGIFPKGEKAGKKGKKGNNIKEHQTHFPSQEDQQKMLSDILKNVTKLNEARGSLKVTRVMNFVIIIVALLLVLITIFLQ